MYVMHPRSPARGFSLIELAVVLTIITILVMLAMPQYRIWLANTRVRTAAEGIQNGLRLARNEAAQRGVVVRFEMPNASIAAWQVCQLPTGTTACSDKSAVLIQDHPVGEASGVSVTGSTTLASFSNYATVTGGPPGGVNFTALGRPSSADYGNTTLLRIDASSALAGTRRLVTTVSAGGAIQMCDPGIRRSISSNGCSTTQVYNP